MDASESQRLAEEAFATGDAEAAAGHLSAAVRALTAAGDKRAAALICARLGDVFANYLGNKVAARPWFARAVRLVEDEPPCVEQGYAAVAAMGCDVDDPAALMERAELALDRARRFGDVDLEAKALADGGLAYVQAGRVDEGMAMIDEAMALVCGGGASDIDLVGKSVCSFYTACYHTADFERVESWSRVFRQRGLIGPTPGAPAVLRSHCESVQGTLLCRVGRWTEAEDVLTRASAAIEQVMPGMNWHPPIALAELRILQGRLAEAEALLLGKDDHLQALLPVARLYLARGELDLACAAARRGLRLMGDDRVRSVALLAVLVEAELRRGDVDTAAAASADLDARSQGVGLPALAAEAARLRARVRVAQGQEADAVVALREGLDALAFADLPLLKASLHVDLARVLDGALRRPEAVVEARAAAALLSRLDVIVAADDAALLDRLTAAESPPSAGPGPAPGPGPAGRPPRQTATLAFDGQWWTARCGDTAVRLRDGKGLRYVADLVAHAGAERHALDLVDLVEGVAPADTGIDRRRLGDAGPLLDSSARASYRRRVAELRDEVEEAMAAEDDARAAKVQGELDSLVAELARAFGLGGRDRAAFSVAEKARLNVTRALRSAIGKLTEALPGPGAALDRRVRTGLFCAYEPTPADEVVWIVHSPVNGSRSRRTSS